MLCEVQPVVGSPRLLHDWEQGFNVLEPTVDSEMIQSRLRVQKLLWTLMDFDQKSVVQCRESKMCEGEPSC